MDRKEAIKRIEDHMRVHKIGDYPHIYLKEALDMAIKALETLSVDKHIVDKSVEDMLYVGADFSPNDEDLLVVMRRKGDKMYVINSFKNDKAVDLYNKLIGE